MLESRRAERGAAEGGSGSGEGGRLTEEEFGRVLVDMMRDGSLEVQDMAQELEDEEEDDGDYIPGAVEDEEEEEDEEDEGMDFGDEDDDEDMYGYERVPMHRGKRHDEVREPQEAGMSLLFSGEFGRIKHQIRSRNKDGNMAKMLLSRGSKLRPAQREDLAAVSASEYGGATGAD